MPSPAVLNVGASLTAVTLSDAELATCTVPSSTSKLKLTGPLQSVSGVKIQLSIPELESVPLPLTRARFSTLSASPSMSPAPASSSAAVMVRLRSSAMLPSAIGLTVGASLTGRTVRVTVSESRLNASPAVVSGRSPVAHAERSHASKLKAGALPL